MDDLYIISAWLDTKMPIDETIGRNRYGIMLDFFKKDIKKFDFYENDNGVIYCLDINNRDWVFVDKNESNDFFYNRQYFLNFLFKVFDIEINEFMGGFLVKRLLFDSREILNDVYYNKKEDYNWVNTIIYVNFGRKLVMLKRSLDMMIDEVNFRKSDKYGEFKFV